MKRLMTRCFTLILISVLCLGMFGCSNNIQTPDHSDDVKYDFSLQAMEYLRVIGEDYPKREIEGKNSENHDNCADWIVDELFNAGYTENEVAVEEFELYGHMGKNISVTVEGVNTSKQIIVGAHYDGTGIGDNGSGVALLLANICGLRDIKPDVTVKYVFFDGEEAGFLGSHHYAYGMSKEEIKNTLFMLNIDSIVFGDYCNIYGGVTEGNRAKNTEGYELAMDRADQLRIETFRTKDLDGYYNDNGVQPEIKNNALYSNPWTKKNPTPEGYTEYVSPSTGGWSDHQPFVNRGITYIYFEASNWYLGGLYDGSVETSNADVGENGVIMNTKYDTMDTLSKYFPGRAESHFKVYSILLSSLVLHPEK